MYNYFCIIKRIVDGDTVDVDIDLGFNIWMHNQRIRLIGIDAPETRTRDLEEKAAGISAKQYVENLLPLGTRQILISKTYNSEVGKYGRILGDFKVYDSLWDCERNLTELMLRDGKAAIYE